VKHSSAEDDPDVTAPEGDASKVSESRASKRSLYRAKGTDVSNDTGGITRQATFPSAPLVSTPGPILSPGHGRYYVYFVTSPVESLVQSRLPVDFEKSSTVAIGRDPGNAIVVPDEAVSRFHAKLAMHEGRIFLEDLESKNGTFLHKGTDFQRVQGSILVSPNSVIRLGTHTIVRLMRE